MTSGLSSNPWRRVIEAYYLATPLFFLVDLVWRAPIRVAGIEHPIWSMPDLVFTDQPVPLLFPPAKLWNFVIAAPMLVISIKLNERALLSWARRSDPAD